MIWTPGKVKADQNDVMNALTESFFYDRFRLLMINQFKWSGLDKLNIQERHVENFLFDNGYALLFEDKTDGILCLPCFGKGRNIYGDYISYTATGFGKQYTNIPAERAVLIENNKLRMPTEKAVLYFVSQLYELARTKDVNIKQLKLQSLFAATDANVLTVKKIIDEIDKNNWAIVTDSALSLEDIVKSVQTGVKCYTAELRDEYNAVMNEALTYFGINNSNTDKRERLITDEANANNQLIDSCAEMFHESRKRACEEAREKLGIEIDVELRNKREEVTPNAVNNTLQNSDPA